jgi:hypothetical protein
MQNNDDQLFRVGKEVVKVTGGAIDEAERLVHKTTVEIEQTIAPVREGIIKRFPTVFLLAVTFGITGTMTGMEQLLIQHDILQKHPAAILALGVGVLFITGRLHKKLG